MAGGRMTRDEKQLLLDLTRCVDRIARHLADERIYDQLAHQDLHEVIDNLQVILRVLIRSLENSQ